ALESCAKVGERLIGGSLGPLLELGNTGQRLIETLDAYVQANANSKVASALLNVHPNTLTYRMRQIVNLTGLDVGQPEHRLRAELALRLYLMQRRKRQADEAADDEKAPTPKSPPRR
ncbi:MAG: PucR family transcriptional regulator, partial [Candidatus Binatia bacterium]